MKLSDFDYHLPPELIAQEPSIERDQSRMMVLEKSGGALFHRHFFNFPDFLRKGDTLVLNDSKVIPARLRGKKETGAVIEVLLLTQKEGYNPCRPTWEALLRPGKRVRPGTLLFFNESGRGRVLDRVSEKKWLIEFQTDLPFETFLERYGTVPLPPYINRKDGVSRHEQDRERYQTVYARSPGSVAAPTAGLHFTPDILKQLEASGIPIARVTLHVGYGTFLPVEAENVEDHAMEEEFYEISPETAALISEAKRVIAVGTTSTRVLESTADENGRIKAASGFTKLFIYPGYRFKRVNALLTNFHLPRSSLYLLTSAFGGMELIREAYAEAVRERYRFYSYGDCMFIS
ncbi:MAG TPA: tRNA preQ1(34) S-adenosylmethionine ribosyltransferase-isomerase QueA [Syntrophales bacterium]|jgi:S-adenosylmethionine:tRNA ribosyltransferase-isomerase|nr:tRNA preQ1(34) S-adenosylmethionine ribosyltransferase-isomerase QueA [Syntrophales bacterium]HPX55637.1 tRNA preQ1(34) S-adenosylmethionine ribosyltransferase-isomerase QueA [Syntrophales bacterium]HQA82099.1 tRNA preQ1(34) S-adenosylmethionine ribosyltransferase-isomerase QueA [Syntrophales bacterium]